MQNDRSDNTTTPKTIGLDAEITLVGINGDNPLRAKVDTGAQECSLDAQNLEEDVDDISGSGSVSFTLGEYKYKMAIAGYQSISSADGGTTNRPTIKLGVRFGEEYIPDMVFNLNDRSGMDYPILLGVSFLKAAGLQIDPSLSEAIEIEFADEPGKTQGTLGGEATDVVDSDEKSDNTESDLNLDSLIEWVKANQFKTVGEVITELLQLRSTKDATD